MPVQKLLLFGLWAPQMFNGYCRFAFFWIKPRASHTPSKHSTTELYHAALGSLFLPAFYYSKVVPYFGKELQMGKLRPGEGQDLSYPFSMKLL